MAQFGKMIAYNKIPNKSEKTLSPDRAILSVFPRKNNNTACLPFSHSASPFAAAPIAPGKKQA
ncbi:MAG TPA: hypothetical protein IAC90_00585 [Candidatus Coproplasma stercorigallinarum]|nr:hypothetical protein [Candidatus Coproplasma stercorigallinarum]